MKALLQLIQYKHPRAQKLGFVRSRYSETFNLSDIAYHLLEEKQEIWRGCDDDGDNVQRYIVLLARAATIDDDIGIVLDITDEETYADIREDALKLLGYWKQVPDSLTGDHYIDWAKKREVFV